MIGRYIFNQGETTVFMKLSNKDETIQKKFFPYNLKNYKQLNYLLYGKIKRGFHPP